MKSYLAPEGATEASINSNMPVTTANGGGGGGGRHHGGGSRHHALRYGNPNPLAVQQERQMMEQMMAMSRKWNSRSDVDASAAPVAAAPTAVNEEMSAPVEMKIRAHVIDTVDNLRALVGKSKTGQYLDLKAFKGLQFQGPAEVIERFQKGLAYLAPEKIDIQAFSSTTQESNLAIELPSVKAKNSETANTATGNLAVLMPLFKRLQKNGMLEAPGVLYDRPHNEDTTAFLRDFGAVMVVPGELEKTYRAHTKSGLIEVDTDTVLHSHYLGNAAETFNFAAPPKENTTLNTVYFKGADFEVLKSNLLDTFSTSAAVFNKDSFAMRLMALPSTDAAGRLQAGQFFDANTPGTERFELILDGTMLARVMVVD